MPIELDITSDEATGDTSTGPDQCERIVLYEHQPAVVTQETQATTTLAVTVDTFVAQQDNEEVKSSEEPTEKDTALQRRPWLAVAKRWAEGLSDPELEEELYKENRVNKGINFDLYETIQVTVRGADPVEPIDSFDQLDLHPVLMENINMMDYSNPTPIQKFAIPILLAKRDIMGSAQTGTPTEVSLSIPAHLPDNICLQGSAYVIPILQHFLTKGEAKLKGDDLNFPGFMPATPYAVIIVPSRELACQVFDDFRKFAYRTWIRPAVIYGGADTRVLIKELIGRHVLISTVGRLMEFSTKELVSFIKVRFLVLDEADRMLDMGFEKEVRHLILDSDMPQDEMRQTAMFSATFPMPIRRMARDFLGDCLLVTVGRVGIIPTGLLQKVEYVPPGAKYAKVAEILSEQQAARTLIFVASKRGADTLDDYLYNKNFPITSIHGNRTQREREDAITAFRAQRKPIMIATDVAARGLDIPDIVHVIK
ncbi:DEAD-box ATP-dependent RNA helicase [Rhizophlyctis rosea]|nr:DEAD-box ATP-dependent RNA helicase [Rhizophlyctis rosea]